MDERSAEQRAIASLEAGVRAVVANAGSGKTTTTADLFLTLFDRERGKRFPGKAVLSAEEALSLLGLFLLSTFTVKAAEAMDRKIKAGLRARGIPLPMRGGKEIRLARTLDSVLQTWIRKPAFFSSWVRLRNGWANSFAHLVDHLPSEIRKRLRGEQEQTNSGADQVRLLFYRMPALLTGDLQNMVANILVRNSRGPGLPAKLTPEVLTRDTYAALVGLRWEDQNWLVEHWDERRRLWKEDDAKNEDLYGRIEHHTAHLPDSGRKLLQAQALAWKRSRAVTDKFLTLYQVAKTRGYHPLHGAQFLGSQAFLEAFAGAEGLDDEGAVSFHAWARSYEEFKYANGLLDYADCLEAVVRVFHFNVALLEQQRDSPRLGFRFLYCLLDEAQDFTPRQLRLARQLAPAEGRPGLQLFVGDGKQSIYVFAGSSPYEFARLVQDLKTSGDHVYTLTTSFRSAKKIVELGNEIAATLPSYARSVLASTPHFIDDGEVVVSPPLADEQDEAKWIVAKIDLLISAGEGDVMVLFRNDPQTHPIARLLKEPKYRMVELLTIHKSKGLEARHVFVGGCTAGRFPVAIGDCLGRSAEKAERGERGQQRRYNDQEVNLVYVAATRAAWSVTFSIPTGITLQMGWGETRLEKAGASPIFWDVPCLRAACLVAGWTEEELLRGVEYHEKKLGTFYDRFNGRIYGLNNEAKAAGLKPGFEHNAGNREDTSLRDDTVMLGVHEILKERGARKGFTAPPKPRAPDEAATPVLLKKCRASFFRDGKTPVLKPAEKDLAFRCGWVRTTPAGTLAFTDTFKEQCRAS